MISSGYSGTPLAKKLGLKSGFKIELINRPPYYFNLFSDLPPDLIEVSDQALKKDFIHYFTTNAEVLKNDIRKLRKSIEQNGMIWISWPKKAAKVETDLDGNLVRSIGLENGLVDIKVCAVDETWSALKFVIPVKERNTNNL